MLPSIRTLETIGRELKAVATAALAMPLRPVLRSEAYDPTAPHPTPVVFIHGLFGDPTNFLALRSALASAGIRNFATFSYRPQLTFHRLTAGLSDLIETTCRTTGAAQVDVIGHSLGGIIARGVAQGRLGARLRRVVTLGAPYVSSELAAQELAIFGASDAIIQVPDAHGPRTAVIVMPGCGHVGLLYDARVATTVTAYLHAPSTRHQSGRAAATASALRAA